MPYISKKQMDDYNELCRNRIYGRILTPKGLKLLCDAYDHDPEAIGKHFLEVLAKFKAKGVVPDKVVDFDHFMSNAAADTEAIKR